MKILYVMFSFTTGGMEKLQVDTCNAMIKRNHEVSLCIINNLYSCFWVCGVIFYNIPHFFSIVARNLSVY